MWALSRHLEVLYSLFSKKTAQHLAPCLFPFLELMLHSDKEASICFIFGQAKIFQKVEAELAPICLLVKKIAFLLCSLNNVQ
jgi:hypothetical protein